jgi:hypothetical protein
VGNLADPAINDLRFINGDYPIIVVKDNVLIQCGIDGRSENNCVIEDGFLQVLTQNIFPHPEGTLEPGPSTDNFTLRGITFTGTIARNGVFDGQSVSLSHPGRNMLFEDCSWENMTATHGLISAGRNMFLALAGIPLENHSIELTLSNCRFSKIVYAFPAVSNEMQTLNIERCRFEDFKLSFLLEPCALHPSGCSGLFYCGGASFCSISDICVNNFEIAGISAMVTSANTEFRTEGSNFLQGWTLHPSSDPSVFCEGGLARADDDWNIECIDPFEAASCVLDT